MRWRRGPRAASCVSSHAPIGTSLFDALDQSVFRLGTGRGRPIGPKRTRQQRRVVGRAGYSARSWSRRGKLPQSVGSRARDARDGHAASGVLRDLSQLSRRETLDQSGLHRRPIGPKRPAGRRSASPGAAMPVGTRLSFFRDGAAEPIRRLRRIGVPSRRREPPREPGIVVATAQPEGSQSQRRQNG
jgi:hypothetical protein